MAFGILRAYNVSWLWHGCSGLRSDQGIGPPLPIQASGNLSFKTSVTKQLKWAGAPS
jgi:hypothetical protein